MWGLRRSLLLSRACLHPRVPAPKYLPQFLIEDVGPHLQ
jgi:hypothetical protein